MGHRSPVRANTIAITERVNAGGGAVVEEYLLMRALPAAGAAAAVLDGHPTIE